MKKVKYLIIGAGISGLTCAMNLKDVNYLIIEKEERPGGLCKTFYKDGFVWDYAGHFFHFASPEIKSFFENSIDKNEIINCKKKTNINYNGMLIDYPFQMNIHQLPKDELIDCLCDLFQKEEKEKYENFEEMLYGKFGTAITQKFLKPYNEKLYACDLNELDSNAMGRFFPYADPKQIISNFKKRANNTYNSTFEYPKKGAQFFIDIILKRINLNNLLLNAQVDKVYLKEKKVRVGGEYIYYDKLINTIPLNQLVSIIDDDSKDIKIKNLLSCNKVLVFNLGFDKKSVDITTHWTYFPMKECNFYRVGYYSNILGTEKLSMYIEIGFKENEVINFNDQLEQTLYNLKKYGIITDHNLIAHNTLVINPGYVHITQNSIRAVNNLTDYLKLHDAYTTGRYGKWTYCSIEDCMLDAKSLISTIEE